jgi:ubiquinone/menaquinone biosynthesis C-methylase UbiE
VDEQAPCTSEEEKECVAGVFDRAARTFDQTGPRFFSVFGERLVGLADVRPGQTVLDVACGRGACALPAARLVGARGRVLAIDLADGMVDALRLDTAELGLANLEAVVMDAEDIKLQDQVFDRVLAGFCLFFFPRRDRALAEMRRVLRPGGRIALSTWNKTGSGWRWMDDLIETYLPGWIATCRRGSDEHGTPSGMRKLLSAAGFGHVRVVEETETFFYSTEDDWWDSLWSHGTRRALERIRDELGASALARFEVEAREQVKKTVSPGQESIRRVVPVLYTLAG